MNEEFKALLEKYDVAGPRYTSYPTVPFWRDTPTQDQWIGFLQNSIKEAAVKQQGAALYIHIPFCEALCTFCGCNTRITKKRERGDPYVQSVIQEWQLYQDLLQLQKPLDIAEIHLGGGTPTWLKPEELRTLMQGIYARANILPNADLSLEADPRVTTFEHLQVLRDLGFNRLSLGIQDFDLTVQKIVNRVQSAEQVKILTDQARLLGYTSINYDLIYGLPKQTMQGLQDTINTVIQHRPDRIAFYGYAHVPWIKASQRKYTEQDLPFGFDKRALYERGRELFLAAGYVEIGLDHFALPDEALSKAIVNKTMHRNFMGYIPKEVHPLIGLGMSAISDCWDAYIQNIKTVEEYQQCVADGKLPIMRGHILSDEDKIMRRHILNLTTRYETDWSDPAAKTGHLNSVHDKLQEALRDGLVTLQETSAQITDKGRPFLRNICMAFDADLARSTPDKQIFSRTV